MPDPVTELKVEGLNVEDLKLKNGITDDDSMKIAMQVLADEESAEKKKKGDEDESMAEDEKNKEIGTSDKEDAEAKKKDEEEKAVKEAEAAAEEKKKKDEEANKFVEDYSKEHGITAEEARQDFDSISKIVEKYGGDAKQLAKANLHMQRLYTKTQEELKIVNEAKPSQQESTIEGMIKTIDSGEVKVGGKQVNREEVITLFRDLNQDLTEGVDDEPVLKMAAKEMLAHIAKTKEKIQTQLAIDAKAKKEKLLSGLSEEDKEFLPDIKPIIDGMPEGQVMDERFSIADTIAWARGKRYTPAFIKELKDKEYKRGLEQAKIVGSQAGGANINSTPKKSKTIVLSEEQKREALDMFANQEITDESKFKLYTELIEEEEKQEKSEKNKK